MALTNEEAKILTTRFLRDYPVASNIAFKFRNTTAELYGENAYKVPATMKAGYMATEFSFAGRVYQGQIDVVLSNIENAHDLIVTLRHELIGHYGLNTFSEAEKSAVLESLIEAKNEPHIQPLWEVVSERYEGLPLLHQAEEVFALHVEDTAPMHHRGPAVAELGSAAFNEVCLNKERPFTGNDLKLISNMVAQGISDQSRPQQNFPKYETPYHQIKDAKEPKQPFSQQVAERLIKQLEEGTAPWQRPWGAASNGGLPTNPTSGNRYKGINVVNLLSQGRDDPRWMTYKQAEAVGAQVRKGEKGTSIQFWSFPDREKQGDGKPLPAEEQSKQRVPFVRYSTVFNAEQIDGLPPLPPAKQQSWETLERAERLLLASGARIDHADQERAVYFPVADRILLPNKSQFPEAGKYYATALHELGHWTGHETRLARDLSGAKGGPSYAVEELRAEISSMIMGAEIGLGHDPSNHVAYVASWIAELKKDPTVVFKAAADAEKIQTFLLQKELDYNIKNPLKPNEQVKAVGMAAGAPSSPNITTPYAAGKEARAQATLMNAAAAKPALISRGLRV